MAQQAISYPEELSKAGVEYPTVVFGVDPTKKDPDTVQRVQLYMPPGIAFGDSMAYNTFNLGALGAAAQAAMNSMDSGASFTEAMAGAAQAATGTLGGSSRGGTSVRAVIAADVAKRVGVPGASIVDTGALGDAILFNQKVVQNPNTNTAFQSSNIRTFAFTFKLVAKSKKETEAAKEIVKFFRYNMYPEGDAVVLSYPPLFGIKFFIGSKENQYIPKIYDCYLLSATVTYNGSTNMVHADGSPVEIEMALTFQEAKALLKDDIKRLEA